MTSHERELIGALEVDNQFMEVVAQHYKHCIVEIEMIGGTKLTGIERAEQIHARIRENRKLIEQIKAAG